jgi:hypothetical protein
MRKAAVTMLLVALLGLPGQPARTMDANCGCATDNACGKTCCDCCGCQCDCLQRTCNLTCTIKKETKTCWCVQCEEFCTLLPGCRHDCERDCKSCQPLPRCAKPKCVKKLVKKEYQVDVPVYKCVVLYVCPQCVQGGSNAAAAVAPNPPAPAAPSLAPPAPPTPPAPPVPTPPSALK